MSPYGPFPITDFGGLDLRSEPDSSGGAIDLLNVELDRTGSVRSRDGFSKLTASAGATRYDSIGPVASASVLGSSLKTAGTGADDASTGTLTWANPGNITASDNTYATTSGTNGQGSHWLKATNFGFSVPAGATITGIYAEIERHAGTSGSVLDTGVELVKGGTIQGTSQSGGLNYWPTSDTSAFYGSSSNLWGLALTPADVNGATFGVALAIAFTAVGTAQALVDTIRITVYYIQPSTTLVVAGASGSRLDVIAADGSVAATVATASDTQSSYANFGSPSTNATYIANSGATVRKLVATTFSQPAGMPKAKFIALQSPDNRLVAANIATIPTGAGSTASTSLVHFSGSGTPETWGANDYVYLTPGDGEDIQGMAVWQNLLFVFKQTKFFVFYGNSTDGSGQPVFNYRRMTVGIGLAAPLAIAPAPGGVYFLDRRGVYLTTGSAPTRVSAPVDPLFTGGASPFYQGGTINPSALSSASMCWFADRLYLGFPAGSASTNSRTLVFDPTAQTWILWDIPMGAMASVGSQPARLVFTYGQGTNDIGQYAPNAYSDDAGTAITSRYRLSFIPLNWIRRSGHWYPIPSQEAIVREVIFDGQGAPNVSVSRDFAVSLPTSGGGAKAQVTMGTAPATGQGRHRNAQRGRAVSIQIEDVAGGAWKANSVTMHIRGSRVPGLETA